MRENHELNFRQNLCLVIVEVISFLETALISGPPSDRRKSARLC